jgi:hypothetical protein
MTWGMQKGQSSRKRKSQYFMINVTLTLELDEFLQFVGNESRRLGGYHIPKTMILRAMTRVLKGLMDSGKLDLSGIFSEEDFVARLRKAMGLAEKVSN